MKQNIHHLYYLFYPLSWIIIALLISSASVLGQEQTPAPDEFIIGTPIFHELLTNPDIFNSFVATGMNTIHQRADEYTKDSLANYNLVAYNTNTATEYIHHYTTSYYSKWEAEVDAEANRVGFKHRDSLGNLIGNFANWKGKSCWSSLGLTAPRDSLMYGPHYRQEKRYKRWNYGCYNDSGCVTYTPRFSMALDNQGNAGSEEDVCKIKVVFRYKDLSDSLHHDMTFIERTLKVSDFDTLGMFGDFYLHPDQSLGIYDYWPNFILPKNIGQMVDSDPPINYIDWEEYTGIQFWVEWLRYDNKCTLYIDYAEVYDNNGWHEYIADPARVDSLIITYAQSFSDWDNIKFWGGTDEPYTIDSYMPIHIVDSLIQSVQAPPLVVNFQPSWWHTLNVNGEDEIEMFYNIAKPSKITLSVNPVSADYSVIRYDDLEWVRFNLQRTSALDPNFWFHVQAHGMRTQLPPIPPNAGWCVWRKPEPSEFLAMSMLGLAHGAKGIIALWLDSFPQEIVRPTCTGLYMEAIVDENGVPIPNTPYSIYNTIKDNLVPRLKGTLGNTLLNLDYTGNFIRIVKEPIQPDGDFPPTYGYLSLSCTQPFYHFHAGFFHRKNLVDDTYFMLVNLKGTSPVTITIMNNFGCSNLKIKYVENPVLLDTTISGQFIKDIPMPPGEGYLFEVAPVVKYGGKLIYNETISSTTTLHDEMIIQNGAILTVNSTYNVYADIRVKAGGRIITTGNGLIKFYQGHKLIIEGSAIINGTVSNKLKLDFTNPVNSNGIIIKPGGSLTISHCEIKNAGTGILSELNADSLIIQYVDFIDCEDNSISIAGRSGGDYEPPIKISSCSIENSEYGIWINNTASILIQENDITDTDCGIYLSNVTNAQIINNQIESVNEELQGICSSSSSGIMRGNIINGHTVGIHLANSSPKLGENTITDNKYHGIYIGSGSNPYMRGEYAGSPPVWYAISGYNVIKENGGYYESGGPADNDGSEIYFYNSNAVLDTGCNQIVDDRTASPPLINTLYLMNGQSSGFPITVQAQYNFWGDTVYAARFGSLNVYFTPYETEPCPIPEGGGGEQEMVMMNQFGMVIDTVYSTGIDAPTLSETNLDYAEAEELYLTGDLSSALLIYESIISSGATDEEKYLAYERKYAIGRMTYESPEFFNSLSNSFANLASGAGDSLTIKRLTQLSTLSKVGEQEYETAIDEFDGIVQQNPNTEEAVYAEIDALTTALLVEENDSTLQKGRLGKYLVKSATDYHQKVDEILRKHFGANSNKENKSLIPTEYTLYQNYPNPFNPATTIKYDLPNASDVSLIIYDILGRRVKELVNTKQSAGRYEIQFNASNLASGVYIYQLIADKYISSKKMILLK